MRFGARILADGRLGGLDYFLAGLAGTTATFSMAMALLRPTMGWIFVLIVALGTLVSFGIQKLFGGRKWLEIGGYLYVGMAVFAAFYSRELNSLLPEEGFAERELGVASFLTWMILLGSWVSWKDGTLLFQAVPAIALFGLVGAFDTFPASPFAFFLFLLCLATLFARAHGRSMLKQAFDSGFTRLDTIRQGPWRWMAGPEWALASAAAVVLISVFGAPILQLSVKGMSGLVKFPAPNMSRARPQIVQQAPLPGSPNFQANTVPIGTGPLNLSGRLIFQAKLDRERYLKTATYSTYERGTWNRIPLDDTIAQEYFKESMADRAALLKSGKYETIPYSVSFEGMALGSVPMPGEMVSMQFQDVAQVLLDGSVGLTRILPLGSRLDAQTAVLKDSVAPGNAPKAPPDFLWRYAVTTEITNKVSDLAQTVTAGAKTDYEKAIAIQSEIERRCKYNLNADRTPSNVDPVENFLFGEKREGYCDLFASAMVLLSRDVGIPARYVRGYYPLNDDADHDDWYPITENCAHAWAELYFEGVGWVVFDATENAEEVEGGGRGAVNDTTPWFKRGWFAWILNIAIGLSVIAAGYAMFRGAKQARAVVDWNKVELARNYERFTAALQRASGQPRRPSQTASEYIRMIAGSLGSALDEAVALNEKFVLAFYAPPQADKPAAEELRDPIAQFQKSLRHARRAV